MKKSMAGRILLAVALVALGWGAVETIVQTSRHEWTSVDRDISLPVPRRLAEMFAHRQVTKTYIALVHGNLAKDNVTVSLPIGRDLVRRIRMTTRR